MASSAGILNHHHQDGGLMRQWPTYSYGKVAVLYDLTFVNCTSTTTAIFSPPSYEYEYSYCTSTSTVSYRYL